LDGDGTDQVFDLVGQMSLGGFKSGTAGNIEVLLEGEFTEGLGVLLAISLPSGFNVFSQGNQ